jgi:cob(I)alamin adenosyltransferase
MKNKFFASIAFLGLSALVFTSCSNVPQAEIDAANAAIEQARSVGADFYVHENFVVLQDSLNSVMVNIETQKSKFIKNYSTAKVQLADVTHFADEVKQQAEIRKDELKVEIQNMIAEVNTLIDSDRELILNAPKGKGGSSALVAIKGEIDALETTLSETNTLFDSGDYLASKDKVMAAKEKATAINTELTDAIAKYKGNVKSKKS